MICKSIGIMYIIYIWRKVEKEDLPIYWLIKKQKYVETNYKNNKYYKSISKKILKILNHSNNSLSKKQKKNFRVVISNNTKYLKINQTFQNQQTNIMELNITEKKNLNHIQYKDVLSNLIKHLLNFVIADIHLKKNYSKLLESKTQTLIVKFYH